MRGMGRTSRALLASLTAALVPALVLAPGAAQAAHPAQRGTHDRAVAPLQAISSDSVADSYGVGIHLNFLNTPYQDAGAVADALSGLGVRHVRDDLFLDSPRQYRAIRTVADRGIGFDLIMGRPESGGTPADYVRTVADQLPAGAVESLEGANEWDLSGGDGWVDEVRGWQQGLYAAAHANAATRDLPVLSPALAFKWNYTDLGDVSAMADLANAHMYPGGYQPSNQIGAITHAVRQSMPDQPLVTTEAGYTNAMNSSSSHRPVPEDVAGVYLPRLLLEHVARGEQRVYSYELIDSFDDPDQTNVEAHFGLLRHDLSPKPAYTAMRDLLGLLADPGPTFSPGALAVGAEGLPNDARYLLTQQRDGRFVLLLWRDVRIYDPDQQKRIPVTPADVTIRLDVPHDLTVYRPTDGPDLVRERVGTTVPVALDGQVTVVTIDPTDPPAPANLTATPGDGSATLRWKLPPTSAHVTGFEVTRGGGEPVRLPPGARSYTESGLVNGAAYDYTVRTVGADGSSDPVATTVVPATVPTAPGIVKVTPGKGRVALTWTPADGNGRPVTAYRLTAGGRTMTVGPDARQATVRRLVSGKRLRVTVQARNEMGWGDVAKTRRVRIR
ncbi:hypothetical protein ACVW2K_004287 [Nocardioides sp. HB32]